jgi:DNA-binding protein H-NS
VNDTDKAILDIKARQRKIRTYQEKLQQQEVDCTTKIKDLMKAGQKQRALLILK